MVKKVLQKSAKDAKEKVEQETKNLCPWLEPPKKCESCGAYTDATRDYVAQQAMVMDIWECPKCGDRYFRNRE
jgi:hypothetical protein